ncbi:hypothetical protein P691DRAFT_243262 [Macrolepiota fuliginosa MF-IS2]|uniref:Uncharacterized protein n=1 Tax=Macrolepiota fuliginosa MF-IS2 TaxID=1400762 RepID=A0A9P5X7E6_9AGAR|nr:hypothetical protein P691DRAFT_243262 [Macrolepiota fuliginosa MF-IS2]
MHDISTRSIHSLDSYPIGLLAKLMRGHHVWDNRILQAIADKRILSTVIHLEGRYLMDVPSRLAFRLDKLALLYAKILASLHSAFTSSEKIGKQIHELRTRTTCSLVIYPITAILPLLYSRERVKQALKDVQYHMDSLCLDPNFKELLGSPTFSHSHVTMGNDGDTLCIRCSLDNLSAHFELTRTILVSTNWEWVTSEPESDDTFIEVIQDLFSKDQWNRTQFHLRSLRCLFPPTYNGVNPCSQFLITYPSPPELNATRNHVLLWTRILGLASRAANPPVHRPIPQPGYECILHTHTEGARSVLQWSALQYQWRDLPYKQQIKFSTDAKKSRNAWASNQHTPGSSAPVASALGSPKRGQYSREKNNNTSLQGDWSF